MKLINSKANFADQIQACYNITCCKLCGRYQKNHKQWIKLAQNSTQFLKYCIKKIAKLNKIKIIDACFVDRGFTQQKFELVISIQKEAYTNEILQQSLVVTFLLEASLCEDCSKTRSKLEKWTASVQVRQHTEHMKTLIMLEQLIIKYKADLNCLQIKSKQQGLDFHFNKRSHSLTFIKFLKKMVPIRFHANNRHLVSHNNHNNKYEYKYSYLVEIAPVCKDDLLYLSNSVGLRGQGLILVCTRITNQIQLIAPVTMETFQIASDKYWNAPFRPILSSSQLQELLVLNIETSVKARAKFHLADVEIVRQCDLGRNNLIFISKTHLGNILTVGDNVLGYIMITASVVDQDFESYISHGNQVPEVILVRKSCLKEYRENKITHMWKMRQSKIKIFKNEAHIGEINCLTWKIERFYVVLDELEVISEMKCKFVLYV